MAKIFTGKVVSVKMQKTVVVEVTHLTPHKLYKKLLKRSKNYNVDSNEHELTKGQRVKIAETKPMAKTKYFKVIEIIADSHAVASAQDGKKAVVGKGGSK